ncbi:MAG: D-alanine--D-alanine ligase [Alphaproteobacteria bacterium]|nr:D-alanine--D-alanine ligase [Alphaproteobacteria bacterium]
MSKRVAVLYGGPSAERDVSLSSGAAVIKACETLGYDTIAIDVDANLAEALHKAKPQVAFNALHGRWGEDGCVQGLLELLHIPYTHSGVLASALAMDKPMARNVFIANGLLCAEGRVCHKDEIIGDSEPMKRPYVIKPSNEGSSVGVHIIMQNDNRFFSGADWPFGDEVLVEKYIPGREIQVAVLDGKALGAIEIKPLGKFYDYEAKYTDGKAQHIMPAPLEKDVEAEVLALAEKAHSVLGCRGLTRSDFRYDTDTGKFYILEVNTQPGMTPLSLAPEIAAYAGISFNTLVDQLINGARLGD